MSLAKFSMAIAGILAATTAAVAFGVSGRADARIVLTAAVSGASIAGLNAIAAFALVLWSRDRSTVVFMGAVLGGMAVRMGAMVAASVVAIRLFSLPMTVFVPSLLVHFMVFLALELSAAHRSVHQGEAAS